MCEMRTVTVQSHPNLVRLLGKSMPWVAAAGYAYVVGHWEDKVDRLERVLAAYKMCGYTHYPLLVQEFCEDLGVKP